MRAFIEELCVMVATNYQQPTSTFSQFTHTHTGKLRCIKLQLAIISITIVGRHFCHYI